MKTDSSMSFIHGTGCNGENAKATKDKDCLKTTIETNEYKHKEVIAPFQSNPEPARKGATEDPANLKGYVGSNRIYNPKEVNFEVDNRQRMQESNADP